MESVRSRTVSSDTVTFYRAIPDAFLPIRADPSGLGSLPVEGFRYCEALRRASAFGWYIFPPLTFYLRWDGTDVLWTHDGLDGDWLILSNAHFPGYAGYFDANVPDDVKGFAPPFLSRTFHAGIVQIWSGLFVETAENWSLLIRPPANLPRSQSYECYEGIIETDRWLGPLFVNIRLTATDRPIEFNCERPLFQVQPLMRETYADENLRSQSKPKELTEMSSADWDGYRKSIVEPNSEKGHAAGKYAADVRKRNRPSEP